MPSISSASRHDIEALRRDEALGVAARPRLRRDRRAFDGGPPEAPGRAAGQPRPGRPDRRRDAGGAHAAPLHVRRKPERRGPRARRESLRAAAARSIRASSRPAVAHATSRRFVALLTDWQRTHNLVARRRRSTTIWSAACRRQPAARRAWRREAGDMGRPWKRRRVSRDWSWRSRQKGRATDSEFARTCHAGRIEREEGGVPARGDPRDRRARAASRPSGSKRMRRNGGAGGRRLGAGAGAAVRPIAPWPRLICTQDSVLLLLKGQDFVHEHRRGI